MPRFYFHVHDDEPTIDDVGLDFPDLDAARLDALRGTREIAAEQVVQGYLKLHHRVEVQDEGGAVVALITFGDAVAVEARL